MLERLIVPPDTTGEFYFDSIDKEAVQRIVEINRYIAKSRVLGTEGKLKISIRFINSDKMKKLLRYNKETGVLEECLSNFYVYAELDYYKDGDEIVIPNFVNVLHIKEMYSVVISKLFIGDYVQTVDCRAKNFHGVEISRSNPYMYSMYGYPMTYTEEEVYSKIGKTRGEIIRLQQALNE